MSATLSLSSSTYRPPLSVRSPPRASYPYPAVPVMEVVKRRQASYKLPPQDASSHHNGSTQHQHSAYSEVRGTARVGHLVGAGVGYHVVWVVHGRIGRVLFAGGR